MASFEKFLDQASQARSNDALTSSLVEALEEFGLDKICLCISPASNAGNSQSAVGIINNFPKDWEEHYHNKNYHLIDPGIAYRKYTSESFKWDDIGKKIMLSDEQKECIECAKEAKLYHGICVPLFGPMGTAHIGLASSQKDSINLEKIDLISAYCNFFYQTYLRMTMQNYQKSGETISLTPKQRDVLSLVAAGKSDSEISDALHISENTVDTHLRHIYRKLGLHSRAAATARAIMLGLIVP